MKPFLDCLTFGTIVGRNMPHECWTGHRILDLMRAYRYSWANPLWGRTHAVSIAFSANMEQAQGHGHGNKAKRRARAMALGLSLKDFDAYVRDMESMGKEDDRRQIAHTEAQAFDDRQRRDANELASADLAAEFRADFH